MRMCHSADISDDVVKKVSEGQCVCVCVCVYVCVYVCECLCVCVSVCACIALFPGLPCLQFLIACCKRSNPRDGEVLETKLCMCACACV